MTTPTTQGSTNTTPTRTQDDATTTPTGTQGSTTAKMTPTRTQDPATTTPIGTQGPATMPSPIPTQQVLSGNINIGAIVGGIAGGLVVFVLVVVLLYIRRKRETTANLAVPAPENSDTVIPGGQPATSSEHEPSLNSPFRFYSPRPGTY